MRKVATSQGFFQDPHALISSDRLKGFASTVSERFPPSISVSISSYSKNNLTLQAGGKCSPGACVERSRN